MRDLALAPRRRRARGDLPDDAALGRRAARLPGVRVVGLVRRARVRDERRSLGPPLRFGLAVGATSLRHGARLRRRAHGGVPVLPSARGGVGAAARCGTGSSSTGTRCGRGLLAALCRAIGGTPAGSCSALHPCAARAYCMSRLTERRSSRRASAGTPPCCRACTRDPSSRRRRRDVEPLVVYAGRHVREKRVTRSSRRAVACEARSSARDLRRRAGPARGSRGGSSSASTGAVESRPPAEEEVAAAIARAACVATASEREGYGLVVVEAAAAGTPSVVVAGPENAATELVEDGVNGAVAPERPPESTARPIVPVVRAGRAPRDRPRWFADNAACSASSVARALVTQSYGGERCDRRRFRREPERVPESIQSALRTAARGAHRPPGTTNAVERSDDTESLRRTRIDSNRGRPEVVLVKPGSPHSLLVEPNVGVAAVGLDHRPDPTVPEHTFDPRHDPIGRAST